MKINQIFNFLVYLFLVSNLACSSANTPNEPSKIEMRNDKQTRNEIWVGNAGKYKLVWTTKDVYLFESNKTKIALLEPTVTDYHENSLNHVKDFLREHRRSESATLVSIGVIMVRSIVGSLVSLEAAVNGWVVEDIPSHWDVNCVTLDLSKPFEKNPIFVSKNQNFVGFPSQEKDIRDLYSTSEITGALYENQIVFNEFREKSRAATIKLLRDVIENDQPIEIEGQGFRINTKGFVFERIENDVVLVKIQIAEWVGFSHRAEYLELRLPILPDMKMEILDADNRKAGFLQKDVEKVSGGRDSEYILSTKVK